MGSPWEPGRGWQRMVGYLELHGGCQLNPQFWQQAELVLRGSPLPANDCPRCRPPARGWFSQMKAVGCDVKLWEIPCLGPRVLGLGVPGCHQQVEGPCSLLRGPGSSGPRPCSLPGWGNPPAEAS